MPAHKKRTSQPQQLRPRPELSVYPRRGRIIGILVLCLLVFAVISQSVSAVFLGTSTNGIGITLLFAIFYLVGLLYLLGLGWSAVRLLTDSQPSLQANEEGLILRHLPFLGTISLPWSEIKSIHATRTLLITHLCIVPSNTEEFLKRRNILLFALNASARLTVRTNTALNISQNALNRPVQELVDQMVADYGVKETAQKV